MLTSLCLLAAVTVVRPQEVRVHALLVGAKTGVTSDIERLTESLAGTDLDIVKGDRSARKADVLGAIKRLRGKIHGSSDVAFIYLAGKAKRTPDMLSGNPDGFRLSMSLADGDLTTRELSKQYADLVRAKPAQIILAVDSDYAAGFAVAPSDIPTIQLFATNESETQSVDGPSHFRGLLPTFGSALADSLSESKSQTYGFLLHRLQSLRAFEMLLNRDQAVGLGDLDQVVAGFSAKPRLADSSIVLPSMSVGTDRVDGGSFSQEVKSELVGLHPFHEQHSQAQSALTLRYPLDHNGETLRTTRINLGISGSSSTLAGFESGDSPKLAIQNLFSTASIIAVDNPKPDGDGIELRVANAKLNGICDVALGDSFSLETRATGNWRPYVYVFGIDSRGNSSLLYSPDEGLPQRSEKSWNALIVAGQPSLTATRRGWLLLKAVATAVPIDPNAVLQGAFGNGPSTSYFNFSSDDKGIRITKAPAGWATGQTTLRVVDPTDERPPKVLSINIGIEHYKNPKLGEAYALNDAFELSQHFPPRSFGVDYEARVLIDKDATLESIGNAIDYASNTLRANDTLIFTISCIGIVNQKPVPTPFLLPYDADFRNGNEFRNYITLLDLRQALETVPCKNQIILIDSFRCPKYGELLSNQIMPQPGDIRDIVGADGNRLYLIDEFAAVDDKAKHGSLTSFVLKAIQDKRTDLDGDGIISSIELARCVHQRAENRVAHAGQSGSVVARQTGKGFGVSFFGRAVRPSAAATTLASWQPDIRVTHGPFVGMKEQQSNRSGNATGNEKKPYGRSGKDFAILIGTNTYDYDLFKPLTSPEFEVTRLKETLKNLGYAVDEKSVLRSPKWEDVYHCITDLSDSRNVDENDGNQLLVYIAGHGIFDGSRSIATKRGQGYIVARDSDPTDLHRQSFISWVELQTSLNVTPFKHVCVILDVCHGGKFAEVFPQRSERRGGPKPTHRDWDQFITERLAVKSRAFVGSGAEEVPDGDLIKGTDFSQAVNDWFVQTQTAEHPTDFAWLIQHLDNCELSNLPRSGEFGDSYTFAGYIFMPGAVVSGASNNVQMEDHKDNKIKPPPK